MILACRDITKAERAAAAIRRDTGNSQVLVKLVDLASLASIRQFADHVKKTEPHIHILINNAGQWFCNALVVKVVAKLGVKATTE